MGFASGARFDGEAGRRFRHDPGSIAKGEISRW
jgi:hypothetical protein